MCVGWPLSIDSDQLTSQLSIRHSLSEAKNIPAAVWTFQPFSYNRGVSGGWGLMLCVGVLEREPLGAVGRAGMEMQRPVGTQTMQF